MFWKKKKEASDDAPKFDDRELDKLGQIILDMQEEQAKQQNQINHLADMVRKVEIYFEE